MFSKRLKKDLLKINVTALAERIGRTRSWVSQVLHGHEKSPSTRKLIADALGVEERDLWPNNHKHRRAA